MESSSGSLSELSENNLRNNVESALRQKGYPHHRTLSINIDHGTVIVEGILPTFFLRQIAVECIKRVTGVVGVVDRIRVITESPEDNSQYLAPVVVQPATENAEPKACPTMCLPVIEELVSPERPGKNRVAQER